MKFAPFITIAIIAAASATGCKKDSDTNPNNSNNNNNNTKTKTELLTAGKWQISSYVDTWTENGQTKTDDLYADFGACSRDNFTTFTTDGKAVTDEGASKCNTTDPQTINISWQLLNNDSQLRIIDNNNKTETYAISELSSTTMIITETSNNVTSTISYKNIK